MNVYARFDEIPSITLEDIKKTKRYGRTDARTDGRTDNVKTVYPPTNTVCGGYNDWLWCFNLKFQLILAISVLWAIQISYSAELSMNFFL